jgi:hypothetical protein
VSKIVELETDSGIVKVSLEVLGRENHKPTADDSTGYKDCVAECHLVLDQLEIPSPPKGEPCSLGDPTCRSSLGHRLRELRRQYLLQLNLIRSIKANPTRATELLGEHLRNH